MNKKIYKSEESNDYDVVFSFVFEYYKFTGDIIYSTKYDKWYYK